MASRLLVDGLHTRLRDQGWNDVRIPYGFVLLAVRDQATTTTDLAGLLGTSKQATSKLLDAMEASAYVARTSDERDGRIKVVQLAPRGRQLLEVVERIYTDLEAEWANSIGSNGVEQTRRHLTQVILAAYDGHFPKIRPAS
jgi:DNA-binding MarR family transcriptional regulator